MINMNGLCHFFCRSGLLLAVLIASGCAGRLQPVEMPVEMTPPPSHSAKWEHLSGIHQGDWFHALNQGDEALDWRLRAIDSAVESIDLQTFIWELDGAGALVRDHLLAAAERGVFVRVMLDDSFILDADQALLDIDEHPGIEIKIFNPYKRRSSNVALREVLNLGEFHRLDHRMHNKVIVVDNRVAIIGGRNIAQQYYGYHETQNFRDLELVGGGPIVQRLSDGFDAYWNNRWAFPVNMIMELRSGPGKPTTLSFDDGTGPEWHLEESPELRIKAWQDLAKAAHSGKARLILDNPPSDSPDSASDVPGQLGVDLLEIIDSATSELWLVSAYLIPTSELEEAIERCEQRGVQVRILTNSINSNNHITAHSAYRKHLDELIASGAEIHEVRADAKDRANYIASPIEEKALGLHAKIIVVDNDVVFVGSANLDPRSLKINTEMGLVIESEALNAELRRLLEPDFSLRNAWHVQLNAQGDTIWVSDDETLRSQPAHSFMQRIEDWFFMKLPIENEM